jgi:hypothetical protein
MNKLNKLFGALITLGGAAALGHDLAQWVNYS